MSTFSIKSKFIQIIILVIHMFYNHLIINNENDEEVLYLFVNNNFEFSKEFSNKNKLEKKSSLLFSVMQYIKRRRINFNGKKILLVVSGIVIGTIILSNIKQTETALATTPRIEYVISLDDLNKVIIPSKNNIEIISPTKEEPVKIEKPIVNIPFPKPNKKPITEEIAKPTPEIIVVPTVPITVPEPVIEPTIEEKIVQPLTNPVNVKRANGSIETMEFEDFIFGVVAAEMPAAFHIEALKAQTLASRTYYLKAISQNKQLAEINHGQKTYKDTNELRTFWGTSFDLYYSKIKQVVDSTKGEYISYNGGYIEAVYYSTNNGKTESSLDVWGNYYPYLISVESTWDISAPSYLREQEKEFSIINSLLGLTVDANTQVQVISRTDGDSVKEIKIADTIFTGLDLRSILGLRSTDFDIEILNGKVLITTRGYGHGVGMSQYGSNGMAKVGYTYKQIINHYYPGTSILK